jgi:hypothetical protein
MDNENMEEKKFLQDYGVKIGYCLLVNLTSEMKKQLKFLEGQKYVDHLMPVVVEVVITNLFVKLVDLFEDDIQEEMAQVVLNILKTAHEIHMTNKKNKVENGQTDQ